MLNGRLKTCRWNDVHCFADATPDQVDVVCTGREPASVHLAMELPMYLSEHALSAVMYIGDGPVAIFTDNTGVLHNFHNGARGRFYRLSATFFFARVLFLSGIFPVV